MKGLITFKQFYFANFKTTVKVVSCFDKNKIISLAN